MLSLPGCCEWGNVLCSYIVTGLHFYATDAPQSQWHLEKEKEPQRLLNRSPQFSHGTVMLFFSTHI